MPFESHFEILLSPWERLGEGFQALPKNKETPDPGTAAKDGRRAPGVHRFRLHEFLPARKDEP